MHVLSAFALVIRRPETVTHAGNTDAMDWAMIATLCFFFFLLGCFATAAWQIWRRTTRPEPHVQLLMDLADSDENKLIQNNEDKPGNNQDAPKPDPWEKSPDWWKQ